MNAFKCDRCGNFFESIKSVSGEAEDIADIRISKWEGGHSWRRLDLCDQCQAKLLLFIKGDNTENDNKKEDAHE